MQAQLTNELMENSFLNGQAGQPNKGASKFQILAAFAARQEFEADCGNGNRLRIKCAGFQRVIDAVNELGMADASEEDRVNAAIEYATQFRDTYMELDAERFG